MKKLLYCVTFCITSLIFSSNISGSSFSFFGKKDKKENNDTTKVHHDKDSMDNVSIGDTAVLLPTEATVNVNEPPHSTIQPTLPESPETDSIFVENSDSQQADSTLPVLSQSDKQLKIDNTAMLNDSIENMQARIEELESKIAILATNNLYVPYDGENIKASIGAIELITSQSVIDDYQKEFDLIRHYRDDTESILTFINSFEADKIAFKLRASTKNDAKKYIQQISNLPTAKRYEKLGEGWEGTYLGGIIADIREMFKQAGNEQKRPDFSDIKETLEALLNQ